MTLNPQHPVYLQEAVGAPICHSPTVLSLGVTLSCSLYGKLVNVMRCCMPPGYIVQLWGELPPPLLERMAHSEPVP